MAKKKLIMVLVAGVYYIGKRKQYNDIVNFIACKVFYIILCYIILQ
jgi:hypothetical protein